MKAKLSLPPRKADQFPISVRQGSAEVKIYATPVTVGGTSYEQFTISFYLGSKRIRQRFADLDRAKTEAHAAAIKLANADHEALRLTPSDRAVYVQCLDLLRPLGLSLNAAVTDYVAALAKLPPSASLVEAVADYAKRHPSSMPRRTVAEVVAEMLSDRQTAGCSESHLRDLESRLGRFAACFQMPIATLTAPLVRDYLRTLAGENGRPVTNRTRCNVQRIVTSLFHFARKQHFVTRELVDEIAEIDAPKMEHVETGIFTPAQLAKILHGAPDEIRPLLTIGAFCGLRAAELQRLDWQDVKVAQAVIIIGADKAKTASRRVVPIPVNAVAWLAPYVRAEGPVSPAPHDRAMNYRFTKAAARVGIKWVKNGLRHSFCSYRLAVTHDPARVATEAGNSANMVHRHYKSLVTEADGKAWFDILPPAEAANLLVMPQANAA